jgi:hypothetical protein
VDASDTVFAGYPVRPDTGLPAVYLAFKTTCIFPEKY